MVRQKLSKYTTMEKLIIVEYIIKRKCYTGLRGNSLWKEMECKTILNRSWQSLKEHFKKHIIRNINMFQVPDEEKQLIKNGWDSSKVVKNGRNGKIIKRSRHTHIKSTSYSASKSSSNTNSSQVKSIRKIKTQQNQSEISGLNAKKCNKLSENPVIIIDEESLHSEAQDMLNNNEDKTDACTLEITQVSEWSSKNDTVSETSENIQKSNDNESMVDDTNSTDKTINSQHIKRYNLSYSASKLLSNTKSSEEKSIKKTKQTLLTEFFDFNAKQSSKNTYVVIDDESLQSESSDLTDASIFQITKVSEQSETSSKIETISETSESIKLNIKPSVSNIQKSNDNEFNENE